MTRLAQDDDDQTAASWTDIHIDPDFYIPARPRRTDRPRAFSWRRLFSRTA